jgi:hypothetical protein
LKSDSQKKVILDLLGKLEKIFLDSCSMPKIRI